MSQHRYPYLIRRLLRLDKWVNRNILNGWPKETISSRCGKAQLRRLWGYSEPGDGVWLALGAVIDFLFFWDKGEHCLRAIQYDKGRPAIPAMPDVVYQYN